MSREEPEDRVCKEDCVLVEERQVGVERWLDRAGSVPITFSLSFSKYNDHTAGFSLASALSLQTHKVTLLQSIVSTFLRYRNQWKEARLIGVHSHTLAPLRALTPKELPKLESLKVFLIDRTPSIEEEGAMLGPLDNLEGLLGGPMLHQLYIGITSRRYNVATLPVQWGRLTELYLRSPWDTCPASDALKILSFIHKNIRRVCLWIQMPPERPDYVNELNLPSQIHLPKLENLELVFRKFTVNERGNQVDHEDINEFLLLLSCPSLDSFTLSIGSTRAEAMAASPVGRFLQQSGCMLKSFTTDIPFDVPAIEDCLTSMPSITSFSLELAGYQAHDAGNAVRTLTPGAGELKLICPALQHLALSFIDPGDAEAVIKLIEGRQQLAALKSVTAAFSGYTAETYRSRVEEFRQRGLEIKWAFYPARSLSESEEEDHPEGGLPGGFPYARRAQFHGMNEY
ncbi:hypothetical protein V5O48_000931 [Marasmius crinis-equi]|uniref:Uncharacterized protein n=1 Tax=Marasmius crinis-equi TaxID=585013 RepID=A0ABR3FZZ5_9AGAR